MWIYVFISLGQRLSSRIARLYGKAMFNFKIPLTFPKWIWHFTFPPAMYEGTYFSTASPTLIISFF